MYVWGFAVLKPYRARVGFMNDGVMAGIDTPEEMIRQPRSERRKSLLSRFHETH
ncbi:ABC-type polar amino acid transport system ATPase subunit [Bradyrhizobium diazoefficiens]|jgi:polar amino acid transport system ATP-binding protein|uniref:Uncharacterized protein n=1 Tax=Bradyrhizobium diazoefficiens TaxID=1355477 RepID=A0A809YRG2_9BRAD|nr:polar amino acid transport system ATP-binding protein [Bradyrhizobium japonicum]BBZ97607.1 hypothetical protein F07S3_74400 [Bradyrhizobium diazoefficiens]BCA06661.1 hypothetical protein H12S4_75650 [Bradyrhizobium diazoefficiens]BCA15291.1 hypothetical protein BDHF08_71380 [Bradyrhizobium diazoefficiens]BCA24012.1 hypothetical protein BDHH15_72270 [Bradyrhizobium diazoefficiens]